MEAQIYFWKGAKAMFSVFRNKLLHNRHTTYDFLLFYTYLRDLKPLVARMLLDPGLIAARESAN